MTTDVESQYKGQILNCIRHGNGTYKYEVGGNSLFVYDGPWLQGRKDGTKGKFTMKGVHQITGDFKGGEITGHGVKTWSDGRRYEGQWQNGEMHGIGDWISSDGFEMYNGSFKDNKRDGFGALVFNKTSSIYRGNFSSHKMNGLGTYLCTNSVFIEANFVDNFIQGKVKVKWQKIANLEGYCVNGYFDGICYYNAIDNSYQYDGTFMGGLPLPSLEACYVYVQLDRSNVILKIVEEPHPVITPGKKGAPAAKKTKVVEVEVHQLQVQVGCELGKIIIKSGTQNDIDEKKRKIDDITEANHSVTSNSKASKGGKSGNGNLSAELDNTDLNCPPLINKYNVPKEIKRNVMVRIRKITNNETDSENQIIPATPAPAKNNDKGKIGNTEKVYVRDTYGPPIQFWIRKSTQEKCGNCYKRFPLSSVVFVCGVRITPSRVCVDEVKNNIDECDGSSTIAQSVTNNNLSKINNITTFSTSSSVQLITSVKDSNNIDINVTCHKIISESKTSSGLYVPANSNSTNNGTNSTNCDEINYNISPTITLRVPFHEVLDPKFQISFVIDLIFDKNSLIDAYIASKDKIKNNTNKTRSSFITNSADKVNNADNFIVADTVKNGDKIETLAFGKMESTTGNNLELDTIIIPVMNIKKESIGGYLNGNTNKKIQSILQSQSDKIESIQLVLIVPVNNMKDEINIKIAKNIENEKIKIKLAEEMEKLRLQNMATESQNNANIPTPTTPVKGKATTPNGRKKSVGKDEKKNDKNKKDDKKDENKLNSPGSRRQSGAGTNQANNSNLNQNSSTNSTNNLSSNINGNVPQDNAENVPQIPWIGCVWELRVVVTTVPITSSVTFATTTASPGITGTAVPVTATTTTNTAAHTTTTDRVSTDISTGTNAGTNMPPSESVPGETKSQPNSRRNSTKSIEKVSPGPVAVDVPVVVTEGLETEGISEGISQVITVQQWSGCTFDPSQWHSLALTARTLRTTLSDEIDSCGVVGSESIHNTTFNATGNATTNDEEMDRVNNKIMKNGIMKHEPEVAPEKLEKLDKKSFNEPFLELNLDGHSILPNKPCSPLITPTNISPTISTNISRNNSKNIPKNISPNISQNITKNRSQNILKYSSAIVSAWLMSENLKINSSDSDPAAHSESEKGNRTFT